MSNYSVGVELLNLNVHHNGKDDGTDHGIYVAGDGLLIDGGEYHHNKTYGIHLYHNPNAPCPFLSSNQVVSNVRIYGNQYGAVIAGMIKDATLKNSLIYGNTSQGVLIYGSRGGSHEVLNNTMWGNGTKDLELSKLAQNAIVVNNIIGAFYISSVPSDAVITNNLVSSLEAPVDPHGVDAGSGDFRLLAGSPAMDTGMTLSEVTHDFAGVSRPQGLAYDIGAYELPQLPMPVGKYPLNGDALDTSGYDAHGLPANVDYSTEAVEGSAAALFNTASDRIVIPTDAINLEAFTITAWVKPTSFIRTQYIVGVTTNPWANRLQLFTQPGTGQLALGLGDNHNLAQAIQPLSLGDWYHVALVYDQGLWWVYVNGAEMDNGIATGLTQLAPTATIGNNGLTLNEGWNGLLDAVTIYNSALTADEVLMDCHLYTSCDQ